jgi:hypothetical protein
MILAKYRVKYLYGKKKRLVDYWINAQFKLQGNKILEQNDTFGNVSEVEFAEMAFGRPLSLLAFTPFLRPLARKIAREKLHRFMDENSI